MLSKDLFLCLWGLRQQRKQFPEDFFWPQETKWGMLRIHQDFSSGINLLFLTIFLPSNFVVNPNTSKKVYISWFFHFNLENFWRNVYKGKTELLMIPVRHRFDSGWNIWLLKYLSLLVGSRSSKSELQNKLRVGLSADFRWVLLYA